MITFKQIYFLPSLKQEWQSLPKDGNGSYDTQYAALYQLWIKYLPFCIRKCGIPVFVTCYENGQLQMIAPLFRFFKGNYALLGDVNGMDYNDFVYRQDTDKLKLLQSLRLYLHEHLSFSRIREDSDTWQVLMNEPFCHLKGFLQNTSISFRSYDNYYSQLTKSVRQNLRTAYNRAAKDGHQLSFFVVNHNDIVFVKKNKPWKANELPHYEQQPVKFSSWKILKKEMLNLFLTRHENRYDDNMKGFRKWYFFHMNYQTESVFKLSTSISCYIRLDNDMAVFCNGFIDEKKKSIFIPRLALNEKWSRYSPGIILVNEMVKYFSAHTSVSTLDLGLGNENYKRQMGGVVHRTVWFDI